MTRATQAPQKCVLVKTLFSFSFPFLSEFSSLLFFLFLFFSFLFFSFLSGGKRDAIEYGCTCYTESYPIFSISVNSK